MDYVALGDRIRRLRRNRELTQEELAKRSKISPSFIGHIERGTRKASIETLVCIANALQCGLDELMADSLGTLRPEDARLRRILSAVRESYLESAQMDDAPESE
jgi:transcriptional regulator with XRE-family HTH domain